MTTRCRISILLVLTAIFVGQSGVLADPPEYRMAWVYGYASEFANPSATTTTINKLADNNFNVVIPEIRIVAGCYYDSDIEPWASDVQTGYDPLADLIAKAHARNMECWAWILTYRVSMTAALDDWACYTNTGSPSSQLLDPGVPGTQDYVCKIVKEIVSKYPDLDGFNFDYVRYDGNQWGYNPISKERFRSEYGYYPPTATGDSHWPNWCVWKRRQVTDLVKKCYLEATYINPQIKMTVDSIGWMGPDPSVNFEGTRAYMEVCQDHKGWMEQGIIDVNILMNYKRDWCTAAEPCWGSYCGGDQQSDHRLWSDWLASMQASTGRHSIDGIGGYLNVMPGILTQWQYSRANGIGLGMYRYGFTIGREDTAHPGKPVLSGTSVVHGSESLFYNTIKSTMFQNYAPVPDMPWKSAPTTGIIFGNVTDTAMTPDPIYQSWIYKSTVTVVGPVTRSTLTDAIGTYGVMDLPPGTYSITVSKSGYGSRTYPYQALTAGQVLRRDCDLGYVACPMPSAAKAKNDDSKVELIGAVVSAVFPGCFYVEARDRSSGIRIDKSDHGLTPGMGVDISGVTKTSSDGERYIEASAIMPDGGGSIEPLQLVNRAVGGGDCLGQQGPKNAAGTNNIGLLISTTGKVTYAEDTFFYIDDGSDLRDTSGQAGIRALGSIPPPDPLPPGWNPVGHQVIVTGISSCFMDGGDLYRQIRATDVRLVN